MTNRSITAPAGYVPQQAVAFAGVDGLARTVDPATPLPIEAKLPPASSAPLTGSASASGVFGPFIPQPGRPIWLTLSGTWSGSAQLLRSTDGGTTRLPLTVGGQSWASYTANANEPVGEESVASAGWYLSVTIAAGTLAYRVQQ